MSVDDWARRNMGGNPYEHDWGQRLNDFTAGAEALADALLSDEAVEAAAIEILGYPPDAEQLPAMMRDTRAALQAAIDAVTKEARNG